jgi:hypothetical protein
MLFGLKQSEPQARGRSLFGGTRSAPDAKAPTEDTAKGADRRLNRRLLSYWQELCDGRPFPCITELDADILGQDWDDCFILETSQGCEFPNFVFLGRRLAKFSGVFLSGKRDWTCTVLDKATEAVSQAITTRNWVLAEDELVLFDGRRLLFRSAILPMSSDGETVTHIFGGANGMLRPAE